MHKFFLKNIKPHLDHIIELQTVEKDYAIISTSGCVTFNDGSTIHTTDCSCDSDYEEDNNV